MQTTNTSVLARRTIITAEFTTLPYEAGWATEAVFFVQAEDEHPALTLATEISPDGINWVPRGEPAALAAGNQMTAIPLTVFGNWLRIRITGATEANPARVLVHLALKG